MLDEVHNGPVVSLAEVLATDVDVEVVVCPDPATAVRWVATNEMPDPSPFLEGGELLLFTGLETRGWGVAEWDQYVGHLRTSRVSALGIATGPTLTHSTVPPELVAACSRLGVNLLTVPMQTSFVSISQAVAGLLEDRDSSAAREAVALQRRLAQASRRRDAPAAIAEELARHVAGAVWLLSPEGDLLSEAVFDKSADHDLGDIRAELTNLLPRGLGAVAAWSSAEGNTILQPIGLREPAEAYVAVRSLEVLTDYQRTAVMASISLLGLELDRRLEQREVGRKLRRRALDLLLTGEVRAAEIVIDAADPTGTSAAVRLKGRLAVVRVRGPREDLLRLLARAEGSPDGRGLVAAARGESELHVLCDVATSDAWVSMLEGTRTTAGVGGPVPVSEVGRSFRSAGFALEQATPTRPVVKWGDLSDSGLTALVDPSAREDFAEELLSRLGATRTGRADLTDVAHSYIRHHGRVHIVADELGMHRNTVRARVREIERALSFDLDDPTSRLNLWAALRIARDGSA
ncbi:PucR family transcriptional regulator [Nocardioides hungaricus]